MASGESLCQWDIHDFQLTKQGEAYHSARQTQPTLVYENGVVREANFRGIMPEHYDGGGVDVIMYMTETAGGSSLAVRMFIRMENQAGQALNLDSFSTTIAGNTTVPTTAHTEFQATLSLTSGGQMDSTVSGDMFRLKVSRDGTAAGDTATGDVELRMIEMRET